MIKKEIIPDSHNIYRRLLNFQVVNEEVQPSAFETKHKPKDLSVEWEKYINSIEEVRDRMKSKMIDTKNNRVGKLMAGQVRQRKELKVEHDPNKNNRAHSLIIMRQKEPDYGEIRSYLAGICEVIL